jgi:hypothetical protein
MVWRDSSHRVVDELPVPATNTGCGVEEFTLSPSGSWIVTSRWSGQGEWGYDVIQAKPLVHCGGILERRGYILDLPQFSADESFLLGGFGERWLGGWWGHPEDEHEHPSCGGELNFGWLFKHSLYDHTISFHELRMTFPVDWLPNEPEAEIWLGPRNIRPFANGFAMDLPGGIPFVHPDPISDIVHLPVPRSDGSGLL